jgi:isoquinoline 1-oxidoreductase subunit beta
MAPCPCHPVIAIEGAGVHFLNRSGQPMVKRRTVLLSGAATAGALVIGWGVVPPRQRLHTAQPLPQGTGQVALNGWLKVAADNTVTVMMSMSEMGQGAHTGMAAILA